MSGIAGRRAPGLEDVVIGECSQRWAALRRAFDPGQRGQRSWPALEPARGVAWWQREAERRAPRRYEVGLERAREVRGCRIRDAHAAPRRTLVPQAPQCLLPVAAGEKP